LIKRVEINFIIYDVNTTRRYIIIKFENVSRYDCSIIPRNYYITQKYTKKVLCK
jgi:hypothetical protein